MSEQYFNFTKWSRENIPKPPPKFKVGDKVIFTLETEVTAIGKDCDGTVLYGVDMISEGNPGWGEESLTALKDEGATQPVSGQGSAGAGEGKE